MACKKGNKKGGKKGGKKPFGSLGKDADGSQIRQQGAAIFKKIFD